MLQTTWFVQKLYRGCGFLVAFNRMNCVVFSLNWGLIQPAIVFLCQIWSICHHFFVFSPQKKQQNKTKQKRSNRPLVSVRPILSTSEVSVFISCWFDYFINEWLKMTLNVNKHAMSCIPHSLVA